MVAVTDRSSSRYALATELVNSTSSKKLSSSSHLNTLVVLAVTSEAYPRSHQGRRSAKGLRRAWCAGGRNAAGIGAAGKTSPSVSSSLSSFAAFAPNEMKRSPVEYLPLRGGAKIKKKIKTAEEEALEKAKQFRKEVHKAISNLLAGAIAGASVESALYPIDTIKTRLQAMKGSVGMKDKVMALRGSNSLYSGLLGNLVGVIPASALFFTVYEPVKEKLSDPKVGIPGWCAQFAAAASAAVSASCIRVPTEVVKSRMQVGQFKSAMVALKTIIKREGFVGMYAGYKSFLLRDITFDVIEFVSYEQIKQFYLERKGSPQLNALEGSGIGAVAGALTATFTTPFDVIKTRMMLQGTNKVYTGVMDCTMKMIAEEGMGSLFKGVGPRVTWISIGGAVFFGALEKAKTLLQKLAPED